jgi:hypothetical protein
MGWDGGVCEHRMPACHLTTGVVMILASYLRHVFRLTNAHSECRLTVLHETALTVNWSA